MRIEYPSEEGYSGIKMEIKRKDIEILCHLLSVKKEVTTTELARQVFNVSDRYELIKKDSFIRNWFRRFEKMGVVRKLRNKDKTYYALNEERIRVGKHAFVDWSTQEILTEDVVGIKVKGIGWVYFVLPPQFGVEPL